MKKVFSLSVHVDYNFSASLDEREMAEEERLYNAELEPAEEGEDPPRVWAALSDDEKAEHIAYRWMEANPSFMWDTDPTVEEAEWTEEAQSPPAVTHAEAVSVLAKHAPMLEEVTQ